MDSIVGAFMVIGVGVICIAAIYQLGNEGSGATGQSNLVNAGSASYQATLSSLFK